MLLQLWGTFLLLFLDGEVAVSTTRPETMLGDVAVAVHPDDPRYQVGFTKNRFLIRTMTEHPELDSQETQVSFTCSHL